MDWEGFFRDYRKPDFIPGYTILNKLGGGVFGDVYKAEKTSIGKFYAIKFLKVQDERLSEQVLRELESVDNFAQVDHPNLVSVEDRGEVGGIPFIVMGYAGDETLKTVLKNGALDQERAYTLFHQIAQGVRALHEHSIVHFDLKPANVFIKGDVARVGDYGLSKLMSESRGTLSMGRGTPYYMAPEMLRRRGDARSDVYSLGVIFYEMLTGDVPFKGDSEWEILKKHETDPVLIPKSMSPGMAAFLRQSLDKSPESRFKNAGAQLAAFTSVTVPQGAGIATPIAPRPQSQGSTGSTTSSGRRSPTSMGESAGRIAYRGRVSLERGRKLLEEILVQLRDGTEEIRKGAVGGWRAEAARNGDFSPGATPAAAASYAEGASALAPAGRKRGVFATIVFLPFRLIGLLFKGLKKVLTVPVLVVRWLFRNLVQVAVVAAILFVLAVLIHLGLSEAIQ